MKNSSILGVGGCGGVAGAGAGHAKFLEWKPSGQDV